MTAAGRLSMLKANLQIIAANTAYDSYLEQLLIVAEQMITREGVTLTETFEDDNLIVMYAAYLYRKRVEDNPRMPRMLRYALNNRLFSQKVGAVNV